MDVCSAVVSSVATTGAGEVVGWVIVAALLATAGVMLVAMRARRTRCSRVIAGALLVAAVVTLGTAGPQGAAPARAAASDVVYGAGCTLIEIDESTIMFEPMTASLLPGDRVTAISAVVENRFAAEIELDAEADLGSGPLAALLETEVGLDGAAGPVVLAPGQRVTVTVQLALPAGVDDAAQSEPVVVDLVLTAVER